MHSFFALGLVTRAVRARSATRSRSARRWHGVIGGLDYVGLDGVGVDVSSHGNVPHLAFVRVPVHVRGDHAGADLRRVRRAHEVLGVRAVHARVDDARLRSDRALVVGRRRLAHEARRDRLRGRHRRAPVVGRLGARRRARARQAPRLSDGAPPAARPDDDGDRRRHPVVRLVRLQRRLGRGARRHARRSRSSTRTSPRRPAR